MIKNLRRRFILVAMISVLAVLAVIVGIMNILNYRQVINDTDHVLAILADNAGSFPRVEPPGEGEDREAVGLSPETPYETRYFTVTLDVDGQITDMDTGNIAAVNEPEVREYAGDVIKKGQEKGFIQHYRYQKVEKESGTLLIFVNCQRSLETFENFFAVSMGTSAAGFLAVFLLVVLFSGRVVAPVEESYLKQKQFITDAGHELKTPLTVIDANVEVLEMAGGENEWTKSIHNQTKRLADLTTELVELSRLDEGRQMTPRVDFSFSDAVTETVAEFEALFKTRGKELSCQIEPNLTLYGDEEQVRRLLWILLDNALKYSEEQGKVSVMLRKKGHMKQLMVENTVVQLPKGNLNYLFERFCRMDESRSSKSGGYGIGLSIAQAVVRAHKGKITAESVDGKHFLVTVMLA